MTTDDPAGANPYVAPKADIGGAGSSRPRAPAGLRITAGVVLLVNVLGNLLAGNIYIAAGLVWSGTIDIRKAAEEQARMRGKPLDDKERDKVEEILAQGRSPSANFLLFGLLRVLTVAVSIAAAVFLFRAKRSGFVLLSGLVVAGGEVVGNLLSTRPGLFTAIGLVAALLAIISAVSTLNREGLARRAT